MSDNADKDTRQNELPQHSLTGMRATHIATKSPHGKSPTQESPAPSILESSPVAKELYNQLEQLGISRNDPAAQDFLAEANHQLGNAAAQPSPTEVRGMVQTTLDRIATDGFTHTNMQFDQTEQALDRLREQRGLSASAHQPAPTADSQSSAMQAPLADKKSAPAPSSGNSRRRKDPELKNSTAVAATITPIKKDSKTAPDAANDADYNGKATPRQDMALTA